MVSVLTFVTATAVIAYTIRHWLFSLLTCGLRTSTSDHLWWGRWDLNPHGYPSAPKADASAIPPRPRIYASVCWLCTNSEPLVVDCLLNSQNCLLRCHRRSINLTDVFPSHYYLQVLTRPAFGLVDSLTDASAFILNSLLAQQNACTSTLHRDCLVASLNWAAS